MRRGYILVLLFLFAGEAHAATITLAPVIKHQFFTNNGAPAASYKLFTYDAGTSTKRSTYTDANQGGTNTNPIVLDSSGRASIFLSPTSYKFVLAGPNDTDPPASPIWTVDNVSSVPSATVDVDITATAGEALDASDSVYLSAGDGGRVAGRWYQTDADLDYASSTATVTGFTTAAIGSGESGQVRIHGRVTGLVGLSVGSLYYVSATAGAITASAPANARRVGVSDSTTSVVLSQWPPDASATVGGLATIGAQEFAGVKTFVDAPRFEPGTASGSYAGVTGRLCSDTTTVGNVGAGTDNLMTCSLPANAFNADGRSVTIIGGGTGANNANNKVIKLMFDGTDLLPQPGGPYTTTITDGWRVTSTCVRASTTVARCVSTISGTGSADFHRVNYVTVTVANWTSARTILFTGAATTDNDIVQQVMDVWVD